MANESEAPREGLFNTDMVQRQVIDKAAKASFERLSTAKDAKDTAAAQLEMLNVFYKLSISHANRSFRWALIASIVGLLFFLVAIYLQWQDGSGDAANAALIGGALIEFIAGVNFYLYGKTLVQVNLNQSQLSSLQRFMVANSLVDELAETNQDRARARLIGQLAAFEGNAPQDFEFDDGHPGRRRHERSESSSGNDHPAASHS